MVIEEKTPAPVVEEKKAEITESVVVEQTPIAPELVAAAPAPAPEPELITAVVEETPVVVEEKIEVNEQTQIVEEPENKVEVKIEDVQQQQSAEQNVVSDSNVVVEDTNIDSGDAYPPPPLPTLPPPSPVMVFAESAMSSNTNENTDTILVDKVNENSDISLTTAPAVELNVEISADVKSVEQSQSQVDAVVVDNVVSVSEALPPPPTPIEIVPAVPLEPVETSEIVIESKSEIPSPPSQVVDSDLPKLEDVEGLKQDISEVVEDILEKAVDKIVSEVSIKEDELVAAAAAANTAAVVEKANEEPKQEQIEATLALIDNVVTSEISSSLNLPPPAPLEDLSNIPTTIDDDLNNLPLPSPIDIAADPRDLSDDISSPLPQNSIESLPSPPTLSPGEVSLPQSPIESIISKNDDEPNVVAPTPTDIMEPKSNIAVPNNIIPENVSTNNTNNDLNIINATGENLEQQDKNILTDKVNNFLVSSLSLNSIN